MTNLIEKRLSDGKLLTIVPTDTQPFPSAPDIAIFLGKQLIGRCFQNKLERDGLLKTVVSAARFSKKPKKLNKIIDLLTIEALEEHIANPVDHNDPYAAFKKVA